jgi:hypothetical protein
MVPSGIYITLPGRLAFLYASNMWFQKVVTWLGQWPFGQGIVVVEELAMVDQGHICLLGLDLTATPHDFYCLAIILLPIRIIAFDILTFLPLSGRNFQRKHYDLVYNPPLFV